MASVASASPDEPIPTIVQRLASAQKSNRGAPGYSRWVNRPAGRVLAAIAFKTRRTPNQVTAASATVSFGAIVLLAVVHPSLWFGAVLALLLALAYALDSADGQLARLRGGGSAGGEWLDHVVDCTKSSAIHLAVLICWFRYFDLGHDGYLLIPLAFCLQSAVWFFTIILTEQLRDRQGDGGSKSVANPDEAAPWVRSVVMLPADYGVLCWSFLLLGSHKWFVMVYGALLLANVLFLLAALPKWYRSLRPSALEA